MRRVVLLLLTVFALSGCGLTDDASDEVRERVRAEVQERRERLEQRLQRRIAEARAEARGVGRRVAERVQAALEDLEQAVPRATPQTASPTVQGREGPTTIDGFLTDVLEDVDRYWTRTLAANDLPEPRVSYTWVAPGRRSFTRCGTPADDRAAFYCPADDTIYVGQRLAAEVYRGIARGFPGEREGQGQAVGDFGVAYMVAHEYAHNLQQELGFFDDRRRGESARPFELQADCLAGTWGSSAFAAGRVTEADVQEALSTALAVGDFEVGSEQHHGTPEQRRDAWLVGFESGDPSSCTAFVRA